MKIAIMQPYFFPYIGYFQLINCVDEFIMYDNIQFSKGGWINRNRILVNSKDDFITIPLKKDSDYLNVNQRFLSDTWSLDRKKMLNKIVESYRKAPQFDSVISLLEKCLNIKESNLFEFNFKCLTETLSYLSIPTKITISSSIQINHDLKAENKVIAICKEKNASVYINPIGGMELYSKEQFLFNNIKLEFQKSNPINYPQFKNEFVPWLSIIDVMMFNNIEEIQSKLKAYSLS